MVASPSWIVIEDSAVTLSCGEGYEGEQEIIQCKYGGVFEEPEIHCEERGECLYHISWTLLRDVDCKKEHDLCNYVHTLRDCLYWCD